MADRAESEHPSSLSEAATAPARRIFISYASHDAAAAQTVCRALEAAGFPCWIAPRDVVPGTLYADGIVRALNESTILVLVLSEYSTASVHVGKELERASSKRHPIIALRTDTAPLTPAFEYFLSESQWIEAGAGPTEGTIGQLVDAVRQHLSPGSTAIPPPACAAGAVRRPAATPRRIWVIASAVILLVLAAAYFLANIVWLHDHTSMRRAAGAPIEKIGDKSVAVLPFTDLSEKKDQEYFADGIAEEVLDRLATVPGLKVVGRASSFQFKGKKADPASIGAALGVAYLLEGSVRKEAGRVRVTAQLVEAKTGAERWSDRFDTEEVDVLSVQDTIAAGLVRALQIAVEANTLPRASVESPEVIEAYLRGQQLADRSTRQGCEAAVALFQKALALDPTFAPAAVALLQTYNFIGASNWLPPRVAFEHAREAAALAQRLDPQNPIPHVSMAWTHIYYDWDWAGADLELKKALTLGPRDSNGAQAAAFLATVHGQWNEARQRGIEAVELDPLDPAAHGTLGYTVYLRSGELAEAEKSLRRMLQIAPEFAGGHYSLGLALMLQGRHEAALAEFRKETLDDGQLEGSAMALFAMGRKSESDAQLAKAILRNGAIAPVVIASVHAFRGEKDLAFEWLDKAYQARDSYLIYLPGDPLQKPIEADPRFKAFLRKMNFPE
jgi:TolB-like protein/tetratricopeptide (TPR) repeat protein